MQLNYGNTSENTKHWVRDIRDFVCTVDSSAQFLLLPWPLSFLPRKSWWKPPKAKDILVKLAKHTATWSTWNWRGQQPAGYGSTIKYPPKGSNWDLTWSNHQKMVEPWWTWSKPRPLRLQFFFTFTVSLVKKMPVFHWTKIWTQDAPTPPTQLWITEWKLRCGSGSSKWLQI